MSKISQKTEDINQYDEFAEDFSSVQFIGNQISREAMYG